MNHGCGALMCCSHDQHVGGVSATVHRKCMEPRLVQSRPLLTLKFTISLVKVSRCHRLHYLNAFS